MPEISKRNAGNGKVGITWLTPVSSGWQNGQAATIAGYELWQSTGEIADTVALAAPATLVYTTVSPLERTRTVSSLANGTALYFAVAAVNSNGERSEPGGGLTSVTPDVANTALADDSFTLEVDDAVVLTNTPDQSIPVTITGGLTYGTDYTITVSMGGVPSTMIVYNSTTGVLDVADDLNVVGMTTWTVTASGAGSHNGIVEESFVLTVNLSDADAVKLAKADLDITDAAGGNLDVVILDNIALPLSGLHETGITWTSSNDRTISETGRVTRPKAGSLSVTVILKAGNYPGAGRRKQELYGNRYTATGYRKP